MATISPDAVVVMKGGIIQEVLSDNPNFSLLVVDQDIEGVDIKDLTVVDGEELYLVVHNSDGAIFDYFKDAFTRIMEDSFVAECEANLGGAFVTGRLPKDPMPTAETDHLCIQDQLLDTAPQEVADIITVGYATVNGVRLPYISRWDSAGNLKWQRCLKNKQGESGCYWGAQEVVPSDARIDLATVEQSETAQTLIAQLLAEQESTLDSTAGFDVGKARLSKLMALAPKVNTTVVERTGPGLIDEMVTDLGCPGLDLSTVDARLSEIFDLLGDQLPDNIRHQINDLNVLDKAGVLGSLLTILHE